MRSESLRNVVNQGDTLDLFDAADEATYAYRAKVWQPALDAGLTIDPAEGTCVYFMTEDGLIDAEEYLLNAEQTTSGGGAVPCDGVADGEVHVAISKASVQLLPDRVAVGRWAAPRVNPNDLLLFFDWNVWHLRSVIVKALLVGGLGWHMEMNSEMVYDPQKGVDVAPEHPAVQLVKRPNPNRMETLDELVYRHLVDFFAMGNAYWEAARNRRDEVVELYHVPGRTVRRDQSFAGYWQVKRNQLRFFGTFGRPTTGRNEILYVYDHDPSSDYYGILGW